ncbi:unnamed protein product [Ambrosiozyma monospora]|uniref:Unnamed protein product n=1 Tax=Ambrosiozyma monospora TaxID=43982 RepID=A0A9W6YP56_AMBMO|nr:unnamed protein product [Ambrosiozyma monospora]
MSEIIKRRKKSANTTKSSTDAGSSKTVDAYGWVKRKVNLKLYSIINELPIEIQYQIFARLFPYTHDSAESIIDLLYYRRLKKACINTSPGSPIRYVLRLMFQKTVIDFGTTSHKVRFFQAQFYNDYFLTRLLEYLKSAPPEYFKLIISIKKMPDRDREPKKMGLLSDCIKLANEIKCYGASSITSFLINEGVSHKVTEILLERSNYDNLWSLENFTNVKSLTLDANSGRSYELAIRHLMDIIKLSPPDNHLHNITIKLQSVKSNPIFQELAEYFNDIGLLVVLDVVSSSGFTQSPFISKFIRELKLNDVSLKEGCPVEDALKRCTSLQKFGISRSDCPRNYKMKLESNLIKELEIMGIPFDFSGCPNVKKVDFWFPRLKHYINALEELQNTKVKKLSIGILNTFPYENDPVFDFKIPSSVLHLSLTQKCIDRESISNLKPYTIIVPTVMEKLEIDGVSVILPNLSKMEYLETVHIHRCSYMYFCPIINQLPSSVREIKVFDVHHNQHRIKKWACHLY